MKLLKSPERAPAPADNPTSQPVVVIINDPSAAHHLIHRPRQPPAQHHCQQAREIIHNETRLQGLIRSERELIQDAWFAFSTATRAFLGTLVSWFMWRIVIPLSVVGMLLVIAADLPW